MTNTQKNAVVMVLEELKHSGMILAAVVDTLDADKDHSDIQDLEMIFDEMRVAYDHLLIVGRRIKRVFDKDPPVFRNGERVQVVTQEMLRQMEDNQERINRERETQKGVDPSEERWTITDEDKCRGTGVGTSDR